jgi:Ca2+/H+ antiporter
MHPLFAEIRHNPLLWLLAFVPVVFTAARLEPDAHTLLFVLSVLAIVPLAALLSHATESVAAKTGDAVGGLLNATLGNLTELVIAVTALRAGQYTLVKASVAGAIVTNSLFMLGASFLLGGLAHHVQEYNRVSARLQAGLLFLATVALLIPSAVSEADATGPAAFTQQLSFGLAMLLIAAYGLGLLFSLKTHREVFESAKHDESGEAPWPLGLALATLAGVTVLVALVSDANASAGGSVTLPASTVKFMPSTTRPKIPIAPSGSTVTTRPLASHNAPVALKTLARKRGPAASSTAAMLHHRGAGTNDQQFQARILSPGTATVVTVQSRRYGHRVPVAAGRVDT